MKTIFVLLSLFASWGPMLSLAVYPTAALLLSCIATLASSSEIDLDLLNQARKGWAEIEQEAMQIEGNLRVQFKYHAGGKSPGDQVVSFQLNGKLEKQIEKSEKNGEETVKLWNRSGVYVLRKPPAEDWTLGAVGKDEPWTIDRMTLTCLAGVSIRNARLLYLVDSKEHRVTKVKKIGPSDVVLEIEYIGKIADLDPKKYPPTQSDRPRFDKALIHLDPNNKFRVMSYRAERSVKNASVSVEVGETNSRYENIDLPYIPTVVKTSYVSIDGKQVFTTIHAELSCKPALIPEEEFTLEFYGLKTPKPASEINWRYVSILSALGIVFFYLGVRFFKRTSL
ncbi:hypothetical protein SH449x_003421 [Pirellulaceae bacterium SH449]